VGNNALVDGNKRLGWLATAVFLELNGNGIAAADNEAVFDLVMDVAANPPDIDSIASALADLVGQRA
jgi:death-on-curing protein